MITCLQNYFIAEGVICDPKELVETKEVKLYVIKVTENPLPMNNLSYLREVLSTKSVILDIDLDFYSTRNPFLSLYSEVNLYQMLKQLYTFEAIPSGNNHNFNLYLLILQNNLISVKIYLQIYLVRKD